MTSPRHLRAAGDLRAAGAAFGLFAALVSCGGSSGTQCACGDSRVVVDVPADRASQVVEVQLSGPACQGVSATCSQPVASGCAEYTFRGVGDGACDVDVLFASAPPAFHAHLSFAAVSCCPGYWPQPPSAAHIDVPDVADDAGAAG
jgi:hypothetical protein